METIGRSADGKRVVVALDWNEVQVLLNACVQDGYRVARQGKRQHQEHLIQWGTGAVDLGNALERAWFTTKRREEELQQLGPHDPNYRYAAPM